MPIRSKGIGKRAQANIWFPSKAALERVRKAAMLSNLTMNEFVTSLALERTEAILASQQLSNQPQAVNQ